MAAPTEVLLTSELSGHLWNVCVWDVRTGTTLLTYKGGSSCPRTLSLLNDDYLLSAVNNKPLIHVWSLQRKDQMQMRIVCPGRVSAMVTSPDGLYCVAAIEEKIHVWQISTGNLMAVLARHYQVVTALGFTDDGSHFISGGEDNLVLVWSMASVLGGDLTSVGGSSVEPRYVWSSHSLPVTDIHVGTGAVRSRVVTSSVDQTCRLWEMSSGQLLCTFHFDTSISSVLMDHTESRLFAGATNGCVYQVNLYEKPVRTDRHIDAETSNELIFRGHTKQVTCLCVSMDGTILVSGSRDFDVRIWDITSHQCVRTIRHKGAVTNLLLFRAPATMLNGEGKPTTPLQHFKRHLYNPDNEEVEGTEKDTVTVRIKGNKIPIDDEEEEVIQRCIRCIKNQKEETESQLHQEIAELKQLNSNLYQFASGLVAEKETNKDT